MYECMYDAFSSGFSATALDEEYVSTFLATNKEWLFYGFSCLVWYIKFSLPRFSFVIL